MRLVLVRHAVAAERKVGVPDAARPLTQEGRARFKDVVKGLDRLGVRCGRLYHSPKLRAVETADLLAKLVDDETVVTPNLAKAPDAALLAEIRGDPAALVGHEPHLSSLAAWLVVGDRRRGAKFPMKKGGVMVLEGDLRPGGMRLVASYPPKTLRKTAR